MQVFFCTVGFGLENFTRQELSSLPADVCLREVLVGKCFFSLERDFQTLLSLKTIERLFVCIAHVPVKTELDSADGWITSILNQELCQLQDKLHIWKQLNNKGSDNITFRVSCRLSGRFRKPYLFRHFASLIGNLLNSEPCFTVDLQKPDLDVFVHLNDIFLTIGLPVTKKPISERSYLKHIAVRSTVCCGMCMAIGLKPEDVVLDPMCGAATLLVEAVIQFKCNTCFGIDIDVNQLEKAKFNIDTSKTNNQIHLITGNSAGQLLRKKFVDVVLCDVPFGRKFGKQTDIKQLLAKLVETIDSVVNAKGRVCILVSQQFQQTLLDFCKKWTLLNQYPVRLGTLEAVILAWKVATIEMMQNIKSPSSSEGRKTPETSSAPVIIALNEEKNRRLECEKHILQLQSQISSLQQDKAVADAAIQRKDQLLLQAQHQWKLIERDWHGKLSAAEDEKSSLVQTVKNLEEKLKAASEEGEKYSELLRSIRRKHEETILALETEKRKYEEACAQHQKQLKELADRFEDFKKNLQISETRIDDLGRDNHRLKNQLEDMKREKNNVTVDYELLQERYETNRIQWESHCHARVKEAKQQAEVEAERRLKVWQTEVESRLRQLVSTLEQQLGALKAKSVEESQAMAARHQAEINAMRAHCASLQQQIQQQQKDYDELTQQMRQLVEAQWNAVNRFPAPCGRPPTTPTVVKFSDAASVVSDATSVQTTSTITKRNEIQQYVSQVMQRHTAANIGKTKAENSIPYNKKK